MTLFRLNRLKRKFEKNDESLPKKEESTSTLSKAESSTLSPHSQNKSGRSRGSDRCFMRFMRQSDSCYAAVDSRLGNCLGNCGAYSGIECLGDDVILAELVIRDEA